ncbi:MAG: phage head-tail connector protein [Opitutaceae bacterium]|nr:phage head-tail connector protein [Opitutaceae bacterium]
MSVDMARAYLHSSPEDDAVLASCVSAARVACETYTGRTYARRRLELRWSELGPVLNVTRAPLVAVEAFGYINTAGSETLFTGTDYIVEGRTSHTTTLRFSSAFIAPADVAADRSSPIFLRGVFGPDAVTVGPVPADVLQAILWTAAHYFENRTPVMTGTTSTELPRGIENILRPYRQNPT